MSPDSFEWLEPIARVGYERLMGLRGVEAPPWPRVALEDAKRWIELAGWAIRAGDRSLPAEWSEEERAAFGLAVRREARASVRPG